jgi:excisionase family DNA binding protein
VTLLEARQLPTVLTVEQAGQLFGVSRDAAYEAVRRGEIPSLRFGKRIVVPTAKALALLGLHPDGFADDAS